MAGRIQTETIRLAEIRAQHGARRRLWNRARVKKLCAMRAWTERELVAYLDWDMASYRRCMDSGRFPGPVCIVLELQEQWAYKDLLGEDRKLSLPIPK